LISPVSTPLAGANNSVVPSLTLAGARRVVNAIKLMDRAILWAIERRTEKR
jgi:hypothetical protein